MLFLTASLPLLLFPGPAVAFVLATTLRAGRRTGLGAVSGVETGYLVHVLGAVVGLSAVVAASAEAFTAVKVLGAVWLVWLAVQSWRSSRRAGDTSLADLRPADAPQTRVRTAYVRGLLVGALNPKTAVFYLAFLPQFVTDEGGPAWAQLLVFGLLFIVLAFCTDSCWVLAAGSARRWLPSVRMKVVDRVSAGAFGALAALLLSVRRASAA